MRAEVFEVTRTEAGWHKLLTADQSAVLRDEGTERPYSSPLNEEHRPHAHRCALPAVRRSAAWLSKEPAAQKDKQVTCDAMQFHVNQIPTRS